MGIFWLWILSLAQEWRTTKKKEVHVIDATTGRVGAKRRWWVPGLQYYNEEKTGTIRLHVRRRHLREHTPEHKHTASLWSSMCVSMPKTLWQWKQSWCFREYKRAEHHFPLLVLSCLLCCLYMPLHLPWRFLRSTWPFFIFVFLSFFLSPTIPKSTVWFMYWKCQLLTVCANQWTSGTMIRMSSCMN